MEKAERKILSVVGARPQFIKLAPLSKKIRECFNEVIVHTGQHFDENMSENFFRDLNIAMPDYNLEARSGTHASQTAKILEGIEKILIKESPDLVIVFGDTNSTIAASLASSKLQYKLLHIEAGLRSFNKSMPEEINRIVTDHISDFLFAPTKIAIKNLESEGLGFRTFLTGDIMVDALLNNLEVAKRKSALKEQLNLSDGGYFLLTMHRPYNVDDPKLLNSVLRSLSELDTVIVFPVHPRTRNIISTNGIRISEKILFTEPLGYLDFLNLEYNAAKILTDSGGIQKEAYILKKPCITLRSETEWVETVEEGWNRLVNPHTDNIIEMITGFAPPADHSNLFGENVAQNMLNIISQII